MKIYGLWHGGINYTAPDDDDVEVFRTIGTARDALWSRKQYGHWSPQSFVSPNGTVRRDLTPCVDDSSWIDLYVDEGCEGHYGRLVFGPRGGVTWHTRLRELLFI